MLIDSEGTVLQETAYYPFGLEIDNLSYQNESQKDLYRYSYNGKEEWNELNLGWQNFGARGLDRELGRWHVPDPLAEWSFKFTPYHYCSNNPINRIDPFGLTDNPTKYPNLLPEVKVTPPQPSTDNPDVMNSDVSKQDSWLHRLYKWFRIPKGSHNPSKTRYEKGAFENWALRLDEETKKDFIEGLGSPGIGPLNTLKRLPPESGEETADEETSDKEINKDNKTDGSGNSTDSVKVKIWKSYYWDTKNFRKHSRIYSRDTTIAEKERDSLYKNNKMPYHDVLRIERKEIKIK